MLNQGQSSSSFYLCSLAGSLGYLCLVFLLYLGTKDHRLESNAGAESGAGTPHTPKTLKDAKAHAYCSVVAEQIESEIHRSRWSNEYLAAIPLVNVYDLERDLAAKKKTGHHLKVALWSDLHLSNLETLPQSLDLAFAERLALASRHHALAHNSKGLCLRGVRMALDKVLSDYIEGVLPTKNFHLLPLDSPIKHLSGLRRSSPGASAESFRLWAQRHPKALCVQLGLADVSRFKDIPKLRGSIYVYGRGRCGFHPEYGHIEILVDELTRELCSDHCRVMSPRCQADMVLVPVKSCDWIESYQLNKDQLSFERAGLLDLMPTYSLPGWH